MSEQPRQVRGYELHERIGEGGFGEVYRAFQPSVNRDVAIKIIRGEKANEAEFIRRFEVEARLIASVEHPHIVPLFDYWRDPTGAYLVMRWLRRGSLKNRLSQGVLSVESVVQIVNQIASALAIAHRHNVVHRDLKPENILLDDEDNAYLTDFGIAAVIGQSQSNDSISGSIQYIAPEQLQGYPPAPTMDIYSLGLVIYELVTGKYVFEGAKPPEIINKHLTEPVPAISLDGIPDTINDLIQKATAKDPSDRFIDVRDVAIQLKEILSPTTLNIGESTEIEDIELENPYKGLSPFGYEDIADFFGRDDLVTKLIQRLEDRHAFHRFLVLIGPSGSGKSSVLRAGLIPRLWNDGLSGSSDWYYCNLTPSTNPLDQLETSLLSIAASPPSHLREMLTSNKAGLLWATNQILDNNSSELFIFIDQFEELFTLTDDDTLREQFLDLIYTAVTAPDSRIRIVTTLRADFTDRPLEYVEFGELVRERSELMIPMKPAEIEQAITGPANRVGLSVDTDLIVAIVGDINQEPGALPLLQYTLTVLYDLRQDRTLTLSAYHQLGGIQGALASRAEETFKQLSEDSQSIAKQIFLRLITLGEGTEDTRRRVLRTELSDLITSSEVLENILRLFGDIRILTFDIDPISRVPTVEVAHEALIREWHRFRDWLDDSRSDVRIQRSLANALGEWQNANCDPGFLLSGTRLIQFEEWIETSTLKLTEEEHNYIKASIAERDRLDSLEDERRQREAVIARRAQNFRRASVVLGIVGVLAVIATIVAIIQANSASNQVAEAQEFISTAQTQVAVVGETLTPADLTIIAANQQIIAATIAQGQALDNVKTAQSEVESANELAGTAQTQVFVSGETLTPIPATLTPAALTLIAGNNALSTAENEVQNANNQAGLAQTQAVVAELTLIPLGPTLTAASNIIQGGQTQVAQVENNLVQIGDTLTPIAPTLTRLAEDLADGSTQIADSSTQVSQSQFEVTEANQRAQTQIASANETLTPIAPTLTAASDIIEVGQTEVAQVVSNLDELGTTLTPVASTLTAVAQNLAQGGTQIADSGTQVVQSQLEVTQANLIANTQVAEAQATLTPIPLTLTPIALTLDAGQEDLETMQANVNIAVTQVANANDILTAIPPTLTLVAQEFIAGEARFESLRLAAIAEQLTIQRDIRVSALISIRALNIIYTRQADKALFNALKSYRPEGYIPILDTIDSRGYSESLSSVSYSPDGHYIVTGSLYDTAIIWDAESGDKIRSLVGHTSGINDVTYSPDGRFIVTASADSTAIVWNASSGTRVHTLTTEDYSMNSVIYSADGKFIITTTGDGNILVWDVDSAENVLSIRSGGWLNEVAFSPDGRYLIAVNDDENTARVWDLKTQRVLHNINLGGDVDQLSSVAFSPNGNLIVIAGNDYPTNLGRATIWNANSGALLHTLNGHTGWINSVAFSPDSRFIVTASNDSTAVIWDAQTGSILRVLSGHQYGVTDAVFSPEGRFIATVGDGISIIWHTEYKDFVAFACEKLTAGNEPDLSEDYTQLYDVDMTTGPTCPQFVKEPKIYYVDRVNQYGNVPIQSCDSQHCDNIEFLHLGDELTVINYSGSYYEVRLDDGRTGFVSYAYVEAKESAIQIPVLTPETGQSFATPVPIEWTILEEIQSSLGSLVVLKKDAPENPVGRNEGNIEVGGYEEWLYEGQAGETLDIQTVADWDTVLTLYDEFGSPIDKNDDDEDLANNNSRIIAELPEDGIYTIEVTGFDDVESGYYTLVITSDRSNGGNDLLGKDEVEANDTEANEPLCTVSANNSVNQRSGPSTNNVVVATLNASVYVEVIGQQTDSDGFTWWKLESGGWVREDVVSETGDCESIPVVALP